MTTCLVVGAGVGLGAAFARVFAGEGMKVALVSRDPAKLAPVCREAGALPFACDATKEEDVVRLFDTVERDAGPPQLVIYNASSRVRGGVAELDAAAVERTLAVTAFGGFLVGREAARRLLPGGSGGIF
ncbi:MAG TPA: SDR family NAD(P)-dependent oxidoreductase, partial [Usitatibacter sp.]|nr:SDR family NAD(P)-dependent oxidoreductase [Usitatibacter sp.]